jgi:quinol monooxygenase YgiN
MQTVIDPRQSHVTLINVFECDPSQQGQLVAMLERATVEVMRFIPGFVSANIHRGLDGRHVANYAQWQSREHFDAMLRNPQAQPHMQAISQIARAQPLLYEVVSVHTGGGG